MEKKNLENMRYWMEPAHPMMVKLFDDLVAIYKFVRDDHQREIDAAFDKASQAIGFVVTTTMSVMLEVGERGAIKSMSIAAENLKGTALETELSGAFDAMKKGEKKLEVSPGVYNVALFWYDAVKLRLRMDWMEPAHPVYQLKSELMGQGQAAQGIEAMSPAARSQPWLEPVHHQPWLEPVHSPYEVAAATRRYGPCGPNFEWCEPVHTHTPWLEPVHFPGGRPWLEPAHPVFQRATEQQKAGAAKTFEHEEPAQYLNKANQIFLEKAVLISAIDEVYPELKLGERLGRARAAMSPTLPLPPPRWAWPGVREPAHMMAAAQWAAGPHPEPWRQALTEISQVVSKYGPQPEPWKEQFMSEIANVLAIYSYAMLNPQPLPPRAMAWSGVKEPAHIMTGRMQSAGPVPDPWLLSEIASVLSKYGPGPQPWMLSEIAGVLGKYSYPTVTQQPISRQAMDWSGVKEPAHPMVMPPWLSSDPAHMAAMPQQMLSEIAGVLRRYGYQI